MSGSSIVEMVEAKQEEGKPEPAVFAVVGNSFTIGSENGVTKAELGNKDKEAAVAGPEPAMVTEETWFTFVYLTKPPAASKADPDAAGTVTKERVPDAFIDMLKNRRPFTKLSPPRFKASKFPDLHERCVSEMIRHNCCIDLHADVVRQYAEKGFAEVGVRFTEDDGVKNIFVLPQPQTQAEAVMPTTQQGNAGGGAGRSKTTTLVGFSGFAVVFALLVVLLSCLLMSRVSVQV